MGLTVAVAFVAVVVKVRPAKPAPVLAVPAVRWQPSPVAQRAIARIASVTWTPTVARSCGTICASRNVWTSAEDAARLPLAVRKSAGPTDAVGFAENVLLGGIVPIPESVWTTVYQIALAAIAEPTAVEAIAGPVARVLSVSKGLVCKSVGASILLVVVTVMFSTTVREDFSSWWIAQRKG